MFPPSAGDIGGSLGLFLGASAITVFEVLDVFLHNIAKRRKRHKHQEAAERKRRAEEEYQLQLQQQATMPITRSQQPEPQYEEDPFFPSEPHYYEATDIPPEYNSGYPNHKKDKHSRGGHRSRGENQPLRVAPPGGGYSNIPGQQLVPHRQLQRRKSRSRSPRH